MLKEVGTSGQISLGKKYAGQLFDVAVQQNGSIIMNPVKVVPATLTTHEPRTPLAVTKQHGGQATSTREWADANAANIDQYNAWAAQREPYSQRVRRWRETEKGRKNGSSV
jgi:hypothetical protein